MSEQRSVETNEDRLPSWRPGPARDAIERFIDAADELPREQRVACFDNDGTLWCEQPSYLQAAFLAATLRDEFRRDPARPQRPEYAQALRGEGERLHDVGMERVLRAMVGLYADETPERFRDQVRTFMATAEHPTLHRPMASVIYRPMRELIAELRRDAFAVAVVTNGGSEFIRAFSEAACGVPPELVVGTMLEYEAGRGRTGEIELHRTTGLVGKATEGQTKVDNIQSQIGRRPILAAGNSVGDREMLEWATKDGEVSLALLLEHDDAEREFEYRARADSADEQEPIEVVAERSGWTTISMRRDWKTVFTEADGAGVAAVRTRRGAGRARTEVNVSARRPRRAG